MPLLVDFAEGRIVRADEFAQTYDKDDPPRRRARDRELRSRAMTSPASILVLAEKLDPDSHKIQRLLAKTERGFRCITTSRTPGSQRAD